MATPPLGVEPPALVLVTGATGFIASHIVKQLLDAGYRVRASVRNVKDRKKYEYLYQLSPGADEASGRLEMVALELTDPSGWDEAAAGCEGAVAVAMNVFKPSAKKIGDPKTTFLEPAIKGVNHLLSACNKSGTVRRVVFTSSITAMTEKFEGWRSKTFSAEDWDATASLAHNAYGYAKTQAERRVHEFMNDPAQNTTNMSYATVLPFMVMGPSLGAQPGENDLDSVLRLLNGDFPVLPPLAFGVTDVRDVAAVHVAALRVPAAHGHRFIASGEVCDARAFVKLVAEAFPEYKDRYPTVVVPKWVITLAGLAIFNKGVRDYMSANMAVMPKLDTAPVRDVLGVTFHPSTETVRDSGQFLVEKKLVREPGKKKRDGHARHGHHHHHHAAAEGGAVAAKGA